MIESPRYATRAPCHWLLISGFGFAVTGKSNATNATSEDATAAQTITNATPVTSHFERLILPGTQTITVSFHQEFLFDADGAPVEYYGIVDSYEKYEVEYKYVAGEVVGEWIDMEWDETLQDYVEVVRKEYQIVREDINETFIGDVNEHFEGFIQYYTE